MTQRTVTTWEEFCDAWDGVHDFLMADECVPFSFDMPPLERVVEEMRQDPQARITSGVKGKTLQLEDVVEQFRATPVEQVLTQPFALAHFQYQYSTIREASFTALRSRCLIHGRRELEDYRAASSDLSKN